MNSDRPSQSQSQSQHRTRLLVLIDALTYAGAVAAISTICALVFGLVTGGGLSRAKLVLFFVGFILLGYTTARLWPRSPSDLEDDAALSGVSGDSIPETADQTRFQALVASLPPKRWFREPSPEDRINPAGKLFFGSLAVLLISYLMEAVFGI